MHGSGGYLMAPTCHGWTVGTGGRMWDTFGT